MAKRPTAQPDRPLAVEGEPEKLPLSSLRFDPENPRIVEYVGETPSQDQIEALLVEAMKATELIPSFIENGYIPYEPLIVRKKNRFYEVIEGNRRLAALRTMQKSDDPLAKEAFERHKLQTVPCLIFRGDDKQLLAYLGLRHLSKTKDWDASAKGAFVERVLKAGYDLAEAGRLTSTTTGTLRLILLTRRMFEQAGELGFQVSPRGGADGETFFWHLGDALRRTKTKAYLKLMEAENPLSQPEYDQGKFENLVVWLYGDSRSGRDQSRVISSIRDIKRLDDCLGNDRAVERLENGGTLSEAEEEMEAAGAAIESHLYRARKSVERSIGGSWSELDEAGMARVDVATHQLQEVIKNLVGMVAINRKRLADGDGRGN